MELTVFILLGVIILVAVLTRRVAARARGAHANQSPAKTAAADEARKPQETTE